MSGLKIWTFCRAICARRSRRISSSLLPLNMLPVMTSIQPRRRCGNRESDESDDRASWLTSRHLRLATGTRPVSVLTRTLSPSLTNGGTWMTRPVSSVAGLTCALAVAPLMPGHRFLDHQIDGRRQLDADRLDVVELDADQSSRRSGSPSSRRAPRPRCGSARRSTCP